MENMMTFDDFMEMEIKVGKVVSAERVEGADKLLKLKVNTGEERQLVAGIAESYQPEELEGKEIVVITNLEPKQIRGVESQGMLLAADVGGKPVLLAPDKEVPEGTRVR